MESMRTALSDVENHTPLSKLPQPSRLKPSVTPAVVKRAHSNSDLHKVKTMKPPPEVSEKKRRVGNNVSTVGNKSIIHGKIRNATAKRSGRNDSFSRSSSMLNLSTSLTGSRLSGINKPASSLKKGFVTANQLSSTSQSAVSNGAGPKKKRAAWDVKGRLLDMEQEFKQNKTKNENMFFQLEKSNKRIAMLENVNIEMKGNLQVKESQTKEASQAIDQLEDNLRSTEQKLKSVKLEFERQIEEAKFTRDTLERRYQNLVGELDAAQVEKNGLKQSISHLTSAQATVQSELSSSKIQLSTALETITQQESKIKNLEDCVVCKDELIESLEVKVRHGESMRRKLHNSVQELKGNIRVFCRVRPLLKNEMMSDGSDPGPDVMGHMDFSDPDNHAVVLTRATDSSLNESTMPGRTKQAIKYDFSFDRVFEPHCTQVEVFEEISQLVQSALDGYNVCVFAYGQTGSGKTFTMEGPDQMENPDDVGMIPRAVNQVYSTVQTLKSKGWEYEMEASFLEIYNETIRDLLDSGSDEVKHEIKMKKNKGSEIFVSNLICEKVKCASEVQKLILRARKNRAVAATKCNQRSSRSHSVFQLRLFGVNSYTSEKCEGTLNLVDLAGSERLKDSCSEGDRLEETKKINSSLSVLGNVIMNLSNKSEHIPYRNSKLTHLLMNSLGGNSKTLMFVNISPQEEHFNESLNSLRFATKVNQCNIGTAQKKIK